MHSLKDIKRDQRKIQKAVVKHFNRAGVSTEGMTKDEIMQQAAHDPFFKEGIRMGYDMAQIAIFQAIKEEYGFGDKRMQRIKDRVETIIQGHASGQS